MKGKFAAVLKQTRECRLMTQKQLSSLLGLHRSTYAYYETGKSKPSCEFVIKISAILEVDYKIFMEAIEEDITTIEQGGIE